MNNYIGLAVLSYSTEGNKIQLDKVELYNIVAGNAHTAATLMQAKHGKKLIDWYVFNNELETLSVDNNKEQQTGLQQAI